jgi:hypothetical protein
MLKEGIFEDSIGMDVVLQAERVYLPEASACKLLSIKRYQGTFSPFPEPDFPQGSMTPDHHLIGITYATAQLYDYFNDALGYS